MFRVVRMVLVDILVLESHLYPLMTKLAQFGNVELIPEEQDHGKYTQKIAAINEQKARVLGSLRNYGISEFPKAKTGLPFKMALDVLNSFSQSFEPEHQLLSQLRERITNIQETLPGIIAFRSLKVGLESFRQLEHVVLHFGSLPAQKFAQLQAAVNPGVVLIPLGEPSSEGLQTIFAASSRTQRFVLETKLSEHSFKQDELPDTQKSGLELVKTLEGELEQTIKQVEDLKVKIETTIQEKLPILGAALAGLNKEITVLKAMAGLSHTESTARVRCWVPRPLLDELKSLVEETSQGTAVVETSDPGSLPANERRKLSIPIILRNSKFFKPFETLITNYGYPAYGEIEPTPLVGIGFVLMFGVMFGDLGQGLFLFLTGLGMTMFRRLSSSLRQIGVLVASAGLSAAFFGLVFGSFFCLEGVFGPLWREPLKNFDNIIVLFVAAIGFGILWITTGLICNIANKLLFRDWGGVFLGKTGLAGLAFFWGVVISAASILLDPEPEVEITTILLAVGLPLLLVMCSEPIERFFRKKPVFPNGFGTWIFEALIEGLDTVTWYFGNTFSFIRIGAFTLAHAGLSLAVVEMTKLGGGGIPSALIFVGGNLLIIVLEGMVVTIQTLRLEYYEFFSKFYSGSGRAFEPFKLDNEIAAPLYSKQPA